LQHQLPQPPIEARNRGVAVYKAKKSVDNHNIERNADKVNPQFLLGISKICVIINKKLIGGCNLEQIK
jgi:hypothetical protein